MVMRDRRATFQPLVLAAICASSSSRWDATPFTAETIYCVCDAFNGPAYSSISSPSACRTSSPSPSVITFSASNTPKPISKIKCSAISLAFFLLTVALRL